MNTEEGGQKKSMMLDVKSPFFKISDARVGFLMQQYLFSPRAPSENLPLSEHTPGPMSVYLSPVNVCLADLNRFRFDRDTLTRLGSSTPPPVEPNNYITLL